MATQPLSTIPNSVGASRASRIVLDRATGLGVPGLFALMAATDIAPVLGVAMTTWLQSLPTTLPSTPGQPWLDGGTLALS